MELSKWVDISEEVRDSIKGNSPVVALESTIISHGMPFPQNLETVLEVENIIREAGKRETGSRQTCSRQISSEQTGSSQTGSRQTRSRQTGSRQPRSLGA